MADKLSKIFAGYRLYNLWKQEQENILFEWTILSHYSL